MHFSVIMGVIVGTLMAGMMFFASVSQAAIGIDAVSTGTGTGSTIAVSHTTSGTNRLMLVGISGYGDGVAVSGVTYNGVSLSLVGTQDYGAWYRMWIYRKVAPSTGTHDVVVSFSTLPTSGAVVGVMTFTGVDQTTPLGTFASNSGSSTTASVDVSSAPGELVFDTYMSSGAPTVGADQTQRWNTMEPPGCYGAGSTEPGAATVTMSWTIAPSSNWAIGAVPIRPVPEGMKQLIIGGSNGALYNNNTAFNTVAGGYTWKLSTAQRKQVVSTAGTLKNLFVELSAAPGSGTSYTFTVMKNDIPTSLAVTISDTATTGSDTANSIAVVAGDIIQLRSTYSGTPAGATARWSVMFEGSYAKESLILGMGSSNGAGTVYVPVSHGADWNAGSENSTYQVIPTSGTIKNLRVALSVDPGTAPNAYRFTLRKNGSSTALTVTITADNTTGNDTTNQVQVAAGDYVDMMIEPLNSPGANPYAWWGMTFVADTDGESLILGQSSGTPFAGSTIYNHLSTTILNLAWSATESNFYQGGQSGGTLKKLRVRLSGASSADYTLYVRANGGNTPITVTIPAGQTTGNDTTHTYDIGNYDRLDISLLESGTGQMVYWGLVCSFQPKSSSFAAVGKPMVVYSEDGQTAVNYSTYSSGAWATGTTAVDVASSNEKYWKVAKTHPGGHKRATIFVQNNGTPHLYAALWDESQWDDGTGSPYGDAKDLGVVSTKDYRCFDAAYEQLSGRLMVVAATASNTISYWTWNAGTWSGPSTYSFNPNTMTTIRWIRLAAKPGANEITLIASDSDLKANALVWSGSAWGNESNLTASSLSNSTTETIAVEYMRVGSEMGKAVVFWATSTSNYLHAQVWSGSSWGSDYSKSGQSAYICWLTVKADPNSNLIAVAYVDSSDDIYLIAWNGRYDAQGPWYLNRLRADNSAFGSYANQRVFDIIFETGPNGGNQSYYQGDLLIVYSNSGSLRYRDCAVSGVQSFNCGGEDSTGYHTVSGGTRAWWIQLERAPDNTVHLAIHDENDDLVTWTWNNSSFTYENKISTDLERDTNRNHQVFALFPMPEARAIITWSGNGQQPIQYSSYDDGAWAPPADAQTPTSTNERWKVLKSNADGSKQVAVSAGYEGTSLPHLWGTIYNGSSWTSLNDFGHIWSFRDTSNNYVVRHRDFDVAFETSDGHILVVATKDSVSYNSYECWYWTYNGSTWSAASSLTFTNITSGTIKWVKLASNPNASSNEIALIVASDDGVNKKVAGKIWSGSSWGNEQLLSSALTTSDQEAIAVEYMQAGSNGGRALFTWAESSTIKGQVWNGSGWDSAQSKAAATAIEWLRLAADPATDDLMLGYEDSNAYFYALKWTGAAWDTSPTTISNSGTTYQCGNHQYNRAFDVTWESGYGHTGHAMIAYGYCYSPSLIYRLNYKHYDGSSWGAEGDTNVGGAYWVEFARTTDNTIHVTTHDIQQSTSDDLTTANWDNSSWSLKSCSGGILLTYFYELQYGSISGTTYRYAQVFSIAPVATTTPQIHAIDNNFGAAGATITIYGVGFGNAQGSSTVKFYNNQTATVTSWSDVNIEVIVPFGAASGYITVTRGSSSDTICFTAVTVAPTVTSILPVGGSSFSDIDIAYITGTNFSPGLTLKLKKSGQSDITATNVTVASSTRIETATFNIASAATGLWDVELTNPDTQSATSTNAFSVHSPNQITTGTQAYYADLAYPNERHLVRDSSGNWYAVFLSNDSLKIYITKSTDGTSWDSPTTLVGGSGIVDTNDPSTYGVSVDIYRTGNVTNDRIHLVWTRANGNDKYLLYSRCNDLANYNLAASWTQVQGGTSPRYDQLDNLNGASYHIRYPDIAVDSGGYPHVVWYAYVTGGYLRYKTTRTLGSWSAIKLVAWYTETTYTTLAVGCTFPSIDIDSNNYPHVSYAQYYTTTTKYIIRHAQSTDYFASNNTKTDIIADSSRHFYQSSLIVDSANKIYVAALDDTNRDLFWAHYNGSTWSTSNNLTNGSFDIESAVVGAKMGSGIYDHILLSKVYHASSNKKVIYWRWDSANSNWSKYSEELDTGNESLTYVSIERHAPASLKTMGYLFYDTSGDKLYIDRFTNLGSDPTVVKLVSFTATGNGKHVKVDWETASEVDNLGFNLYRSTKKEGRYTKLNKSLIPGLLSSVTGRKYTYADKKVIKGKLYYYKLEDIDLSGKKTMHGPICVDWNGDGIPDDEQLKKKSPGLSRGGSSRRPVMEDSRSKSPYDEGSRVIAPETRSFTARQKENHVLLEWRTPYEVNTLGYHVYREENSVFLRLTPELVAGSALFAGNALPAGNAYSWWDDLSMRPLALEDRPAERGLRTIPLSAGLEDRPVGLKVIASSEAILKRSDPQVTPEAERSSNRTVAYWLEEVTLAGDRSWCGPVTPVLDDTLKLPGQIASHYSPLLSKLGEETENLTLFSSGVPSTLQAKPVLGSVSAWDLAAGPAIKLSVSERGWYRVTQPQLLAAGLDPGVNPRFLQLFVDGEEQPMLVRGQKDGLLDPGDTIEFYAEGLETLFTDTRVYWLVPGTTPGKRITTVINRPGPAFSESSFPSTLEFKERSMYFSALKNGEQNNFFGPVIGAEPLEHTLEVQNLATTYRGKTTISVSVQGVTLKPHRVRVLFNGVSLGRITFDDQAHKQADFVVSHSKLREGENTLRLVAEGDELDVSLLDTVQLTYRHTYKAEEDTLLCRVSQGGMVTISGFSSPNVRVVDITNPNDMKMVAATAVQQGPSDYSARVYNSAKSGNRTWYVFSEEAIKTPVEIKANQVSTWHQENQGAELVILSHGDFKQSLEPLKTYRESRGLSVALVDVEDIFDEFSYGAKTPQAIKDFLTRASTSWQTPPRFVLLVGDASFDPRNYLGLGNFDFLPTKLVDTGYMETASDDWFVDFNGDGLPDMAIGRLPVQTAEESATVVSKIIAYDQAEAGDWATEALMVADQNGGFDFEGGSQEVEDLLPEQMTVWSVYRGQAGDGAARTAILGSINEGKLLVNYIGHGAVDLWRGSVLTVSDADSLTNGSALPLVVGMTCLNGFFQTPYVESLAEALLKAENGGAVAVWTSSGLTDPAAQLQMNKGLVRLLFNGEELTLGEAAAQAKAATDDIDVRRSWILFGDPTTRLKP